MERVNSQLLTNDPGRLFAVIHMTGKQRKVTVEDIIVLQNHLEADVGERIILNKVLTFPCRNIYKELTNMYILHLMKLFTAGCLCIFCGWKQISEYIM